MRLQDVRVIPLRACIRLAIPASILAIPVSIK